MFKRWWIIETNLYFVPHTEEIRREYGPFTKREADEIALDWARGAARIGIQREYYVTKNVRLSIYGGNVDND